MSVNFRACALLASTLLIGASAHAMTGDAYIFGSSSASTSNVLTLNGAQSLQVINSGWYRSGDFEHIPSNDNYIAGYCANCGGYSYNNFFVVDLTGVTAPVTSASLTLYNYDVTAPLQYTLVDYTGNVDTLINSNGDAGIYADLGSGVAYGGDLVSVSNTTQTFTLNNAFLTNINAAIAAGQTRFAIGGTTTAVPEAGTLAYLALGLSLVSVVARRRAA